MNTIQLLVLTAAMGLGMAPVQAQRSTLTKGVAPAPRPSDSWNQPGGPKPPQIAGKQNAALLYYQAWDSIDLSIFEQVQRNTEGKPVPAAQVKVLNDNQKFIEAVLRASSTADCDWGTDYSAGPNALLPHLGHLRSTARFLGADARRCVQEGDIKAAAKRVVAIVQMSHQLRGEGVMISALVAAAINQHARTIAKTMMVEGTLTPEAGHVILAAFKAVPEDPFGFKACMATERRLGLDWIRESFTGPDAGMQLSKSYIAEGTQPETVAAIEKLSGEELRLQLDKAGLYYDELEKLWGQEGKEKEFAVLERRLEKGEFGTVAMVIAPAISKANASYLKSRAATGDFEKELAEYIRNWKPAGAGAERSGT